ncbi:MAG: hypothetical protein ABJP42_20085, partial [Pseudophaeobacter sp.]
MRECRSHTPAKPAAARRSLISCFGLLGLALSGFLAPQIVAAQSALPKSLDELVQVEILDGGVRADGTYVGALR